MKNTNTGSKKDAKETEKKIKDGSFEGEHMKNVVELPDKATRVEYGTVANQDSGKGGSFIKVPENNVEYGSKKDSDGKDVRGRGTVSAAGGFIRGQWSMHTHPSGSFVGKDGNTYSSMQAPSKTDIDSAKGNEYVFARSQDQVYIYNSTGVIATLPQDAFVNTGK